MSVACPVFGDKSYLTVSSETVFGTEDVSPDYVYVPVTNYGIELLSTKRDAATYTGMAQKNDKMIGDQHTAGPISMPLYGWRLGDLETSLAEYIMAWAFTDLETLCGLPSKSCQWAEGPNVSNKKHLGTTVNSATLTGSDDNASTIALTLDCLGANENTLTTAQTIPDDLDRLNEFLFRDSQFLIGPNSGGLVAMEYKGFNWQVQRNLQAVYNGSLTPRRFWAGAPAATFDFNLDKADGTWDAIRRSSDVNNYYGRLILKGLHNGTGATGNYTKVQIDFPKLAFNIVKDTWARNGAVQQQVTFDIQKPPSATASYSMTWSEV